MKQLSGKLELSVVLPLIRNKGSHAVIDGIRVKVSGVRLTTFATQGTDCVCCDREGAFFRIEDNESGPHLNLYAYNSHGGEALMTRDHIVPRSMKGPETVANMSPMCSRCNRLRGVKDQAKFIADYKAGRYDFDGDLKRKKSDTKANKPTVKKRNFGLPVYMAGRLDAHVHQYGYESHMQPVWDEEVQSYISTGNSDLMSKCMEIDDDIGMGILDYLETARRCRRVSRYAKHISGRVEVHVMERPQAFGMLITLSRRHVDAPTAESEERLRAHLKICKNLR